ncbi:unnamed protein product [Gordionus sp. m RMFG-2023]
MFFYSEIDVEIYKKGDNPSNRLLKKLKILNISIGHLLKVFEEFEYDPPLLLFRTIETVKIIKEPPNKLVINNGGTIYLECIATGFPHPLYQWFRKKEFLKDQQKNILKITNAQLIDQGLYICRVHNSGMKNSIFTNWSIIKIIFDIVKDTQSKDDAKPIYNKLVPFKPPKITRHPIAYLEIEENSTITLNCCALGIPNISFQWFKDGNTLEGQIYPNLNIVNCQQCKHEGIYQCKVSNDNGFVWSCQSQVTFLTNYSNLPSNKCNALSHLSDVKMPEIIYHPQAPSDRITVGSSIILACRAVGKLPLRYEWYKNNQIISGVETNELKFLNIQSDTEDGGCYQCRVYNTFGSSLSKPARICLDFTPDSIQITATDKIAILIGNYDYSPLLNSLETVKNDCKTLAARLDGLGFKVFTYLNLNHREMLEKIKIFIHTLKHSFSSRMYFVFYFGGHGFEKNGKSFLVPIQRVNNDNTQPLNSISQDLKNECICVERDVLYKLNDGKNNPSLIVFLLDICRLEEIGLDHLTLTNQHTEDFANQHSLNNNDVNLANPIMDTLTSANPCGSDLEIGGNYIFGYATSISNRAFEMEGQVNSIFMTHLLKFISLALPIEEILRLTRQSVFATEPLAKSNNQFPEIRSNLSKSFSLADKIVPKEP